MSGTIQKSEFAVALQRLESLAKGQGQTQLFATPSDSSPGTWAGTTEEDIDEHKSEIDENGTDYNGVQKALANKVAKSKALTPAEVAIVKGSDPRQLIAKKIVKGQKLTPAESWAIKGGAKFFSKNDDKDKDDEVEKGEGPSKAPAPGLEIDANTAPETNAGKDEDDVESDAKKSLTNAVAMTNDLSKGIEVSPVLYELVRAIGAGLEGAEVGTSRKISKALTTEIGKLVGRIQGIEKSLNDQAEFNKGFAETLVGIGQHVAGQSQVFAAQASAPVGPPRAVQGVRQLEKSFAGGLDVSTDALNKSQITDAMVDMVQKGRLSAMEVVKFESTGELNTSVRNSVMKHLQGSN